MPDRRLGNCRQALLQPLRPLFAPETSDICRPERSPCSLIRKLINQPFNLLLGDFPQIVPLFDEPAPSHTDFPEPFRN